MSLRSHLCRLADAHPELQEDLLPLLLDSHPDLAMLRTARTQTITVYRFGTSSGPLDNRNAGSLMGVVAHMDKVSGDSKLKWAKPKGKITQYKVKVEAPLGDYQPFVAGRPRDVIKNLDSVGMAKASWGHGAVWYSFPKACGCWKEQGRGKSVSVQDLPDGWGMMGWVEQAAALERMF